MCSSAIQIEEWLQVVQRAAVVQFVNHEDKVFWIVEDQFLDQDRSSIMYNSQSVWDKSLEYDKLQNGSTGNEAQKVLGYTLT